MEYNMAKQKMKKVIVLVSALMLGFAVSASAQDNRSTSTQSPRETHNVSSRPASQSPRETRANSYSESNSDNSLLHELRVPLVIIMIGYREMQQRALSINMESRETNYAI